MLAGLHNVGQLAVFDIHFKYTCHQWNGFTPGFKGQFPEYGNSWLFNDQVTKLICLSISFWKMKDKFHNTFYLLTPWEDILMATEKIWKFEVTQNLPKLAPNVIYGSLSQNYLSVPSEDGMDFPWSFLVEIFNNLVRPLHCFSKFFNNSDFPWPLQKTVKTWTLSSIRSVTRVNDISNVE